MRTIVILYSILGLSSIGFTQNTLQNRILHNNVEREYILYVPASYTGDEAVPLLFNFHGYTFTADNQMGYGDFRGIADTAGFIIVHPQGTLFNGNTHFSVGAWTTGSTADDVGFTEALLDSLSREYNIDATRVYSTGFSNGGVFSFLLACQLGHKFAAVASVGGSMTPFIYNDCNPSQPTPIFQVHGTEDGVIPYGGAAWTWSIDSLIAFWTEHNNGQKTPTKSIIPDINSTDESTIEHQVWAGGDAGTSVEHLKVIGGRHTWPGTALAGAGTNQDINASIEIWNFFSRYNIDGLSTTTRIEPLGVASPNITIYPNPTLSKISIEMKHSEKTNIQLTSISGERLLTEYTRADHHEIDLSAFPAGAYILEIGGHRYKVLKN